MIEDDDDIRQYGGTLLGLSFLHQSVSKEKLMERKLKDYFINPAIPKEALEFKKVVIARATRAIHTGDVLSLIMKHVKKAESISDWCLYEIFTDLADDGLVLVMARIKQPDLKVIGNVRFLEKEINACPEIPETLKLETDLKARE